MSNLGFRKALDSAGINKRRWLLLVTAMSLKKWEKIRLRQRWWIIRSHVILMDHNTTGDDQLSMSNWPNHEEKQARACQLASRSDDLPQKLVNLRVENAMKETHGSTSHQDNHRKMKKEMAGSGRILVRLSGQGPLLRVMAEAPTRRSQLLCRYDCCCG